MARRQNRHVISPGLERPPGTKPAGADPQSPMRPVTDSRVLEMVNRMASEIERDELRLRELLRSLVSAGQSEEALRLLAAWDESPASDVLKLSKRRERGS